MSAHFEVADFLTILEGNSGLFGQLRKDIIQAGDCAGIQFNTGCAFHFCHQLLNLSNGSLQFRNAHTVLQGLRLSEELINPLGEVNVYIAVDCAQSILTESTIGLNTSSDDGRVGSQSLNRGSYRDHIRNIDTGAIIFLDHVFNGNGCLCGLNDQCANSDTCGGDHIVFVTSGDNCGNGVCTCMDRSSFTCVGDCVGLCTCIYVFDAVVGYFLTGILAVLAGNPDLLHAVLNIIIEGEQPLGVYFTVAIDKFHIQRICSNDKCTCNGLGVVHLVAPVDDHSDFGIAANIQLGLVGFQNDVAINVQTQENFHQLGLCFFDAALSNTGDLCAHVIDIVGQQAAGNDTVGILNDPIDLRLLAIRCDGDNAGTEVGFVVAVRRNSTNQIYTDIGRQIAANGNFDVCSFGGQAVQHVQQNIDHFLIFGILKILADRVQITLQLRQSHGNAVFQTNGFQK